MLFTKQTPEEDSSRPVKNERLSYILDVYKLYHGHINTMFNYFLACLSCGRYSGKEPLF